MIIQYSEQGCASRSPWCLGHFLRGVRGRDRDSPWRQTHRGDHLGPQQGPPPRPQAAGVDPDRIGRRV